MADLMAKVMLKLIVNLMDQWLIDVGHGTKDWGPRCCEGVDEARNSDRAC